MRGQGDGLGAVRPSPSPCAAGQPHDGAQRAGAAGAVAPSSVTPRPSSTWKFMPCRMCDSPYQACRSFTSVKRAHLNARPLQFGIGAAHVGLDHRRVLRHLAYGPRPASPRAQHGDGVGRARPRSCCARPSARCGRPPPCLMAARDAVDVLARPMPWVGSSSSIRQAPSPAWWRSRARACGRS